MDRRLFLRTTAAAVPAAVLVAAGCQPAPSRVFLHGVAAGDPLPDRILLWTRITPTPDATPGSGKGAPVEVRWEVARDSSFATIVKRGTVTTTAARDHTVKVDATGLSPDTEYWYRFSGAGGVSPLGRARTAPAAQADVSRLRLGVVSCSNMAEGWFTAYRRLAERDDLHAVLHLGDYLYEYGTGEYGSARAPVPAHEIVTLADYRKRHAQYKGDPDLQALHARYAFVCTWDDHEITNDSWRDGADNHQPEEGSWATRKANGRKAYFEWMPVREAGSGSTRIYRTLRFGRLAQLQMADLRSYRDQQPSNPLDTATIRDPERTILGDAQEGWLHDGLRTATSTWKLLGSSVMLTPLTLGGIQHLPGVPDELDPILVPLVDRALAGLTGGTLPATGVPINVDAWDGYGADQAALLDLLRTQEIPGFISLVGDIHSAWACELQPAGSERPVGVELVCTSITSDNVDDIVTEALTGAVGLPANIPSPGVLGTTAAVAAETLLPVLNPDVRMVDLRGHGYSILELTPAAAQMDWWEVDPHVKGAATRWARSMRTRLGTNQLQRATAPVDPYWRPRAMATGSTPTPRAATGVAVGGAALGGLLALRTRRSGGLLPGIGAPVGTPVDGFDVDAAGSTDAGSTDAGSTVVAEEVAR